MEWRRILEAAVAFLTSVFMEVSSAFVTPMRKFSRSSSSSSTEASPEEKQAKGATSLKVTISSDAEKTMAAKYPVEGIKGKPDLIISRLDSMEFKDGRNKPYR